MLTNLFYSYVGQVDYEATIDDLRGHFAPCGTIKRVTILCDKYTGHAKGYVALKRSNYFFNMVCLDLLM